MHETDADSSQRFDFGGVFHAFSDDLNARLAANLDHASDDRRAPGVLEAVSDQCAIDFDDIGYQFGKVGETGIARIEIIERDFEARGLISGDNTQQMTKVNKFLLLDDFEADAVE